MTAGGQPLPGAADWVGCLVLVTPTAPLLRPATEAVHRAEAAIFADPLLADMAGVAVSPVLAARAAADPGTGMDDLAVALRDEFLHWSLATGRITAPRLTFGLLVVHHDAAAAVQLIRHLAANQLLCELPVVFRTGDSGPLLDDRAAEWVARTGDAVLEAVDVTAKEVERSAGFSIAARSLRGMVRPARAAEPGALPPARPRHAAPPAEPARPRPAALPAAPSFSTPRRALPAAPRRALEASPPPASGIEAGPWDPEVARARSTTGSELAPAPRSALVDAGPAGPPLHETTAAPPPAPEPGSAEVAASELPAPPVGPEPAARPALDDRDGSVGDGAARDEADRDEADRDEADRDEAAGDGWNLGWDRLRSGLRRLAEPRLPASNLDVIDAVSDVAEQVRMVYVVLASAPRRPPNRLRKRRIDVATRALAALLAQNGQQTLQQWYARTFSAGDTLRAGDPLPHPDRLRQRDLPDRWGEYIDLFECAGELRHALAQDAASFDRRGRGAGLRPLVLFYAVEPPAHNPGTLERLADLCAVATVIWVTFGPDPGAPSAGLTATGVQSVHDKDDVLRELLDLVQQVHADSTSTEPDGEADAADAPG